MSIEIPKLILLELRFRTLKPIDQLPHGHGAHWGALFRNLIKPYLGHDSSMAKAGIWIQHVESGILSYQEGDPIHLGFSFLHRHSRAMGRLLHDFNNLETGKGHFQPGTTIRLEHIFCRITGGPWRPDESPCLSRSILLDEIEVLSQASRFTIHFHVPLRLTRPKGYKAKGHRFCDEDFFLGPGCGAFHVPLAHLVRKIRTRGKSIEDATSLHIIGGALTWLDISYGEHFIKTIGGVVGKISIEGNARKEIAELLVAGQYVGAGKNPTFGFGFYDIPELDDSRLIRKLTRGKSILERALAPQTLKRALFNLPNSSPGPDMLSIDDLRKAGDNWLESLSAALVKGTYRQGGVKKYRLPKHKP